MMLTVTGQYYAEECLGEVQNHYSSRRPSRGAEGIRLLHDNARPYKAKVVREMLSSMGMIELPHPPYSPDLSPCDFWLFNIVKSTCLARFLIPDCLLDMNFIRC